jgi:antirestriction protein ArdC
MSETKTDIYTTVTNKILADLENGNLPWHKSWNGGDSLALPLRWNGESYNGINIIMLWCSSMAKGYKSRTWMTFKQALELGAAVRKGEKGSPVVYANAIMKNELNEKTGSEEERAIHYLKSYTVFNVEQIDGLPDRFKVSEQPQFTNPDDRNAGLDSYFKATGADIRHGGTRAFFAPQPDFVQMPEFKDFESAEAYYSVLAHEMTHWTGHKARLAREQKSYNDSQTDYAKEELIAELGAAFLCAELAITPETRLDHAAYIQNWIAALKNDKRFIFSAASHASKAVDYLNRITGRKASTNQEAEA